MKKPIKRTGGNGRRSTCVAHNGVLYTSGITTVDLEADITGQTQDVFAQLDKLMQYNNTDKSNIVFANIHLKDMADYAAFNAVWDAWISDGNEPARQVVQAPLPLSRYRVKVSLIVALAD